MFRIQEITYANNCVFHYSFRESGLQITLRLLSSSLGNTVLLHTLFLEYKTQIGKKNTGQCLIFNRIAVHMQNF